MNTDIEANLEDVREIELAKYSAEEFAQADGENPQPGRASRGTEG